MRHEHLMNPDQNPQLSSTKLTALMSEYNLSNKYLSRIHVIK